MTITTSQIWIVHVPTSFVKFSVAHKIIITFKAVRCENAHSY